MNTILDYVKLYSSVNKIKSQFMVENKAYFKKPEYVHLRYLGSTGKSFGSQGKRVKMKIRN